MKLEELPKFINQSLLENNGKLLSDKARLIEILKDIFLDHKDAR